MFRKVSTTYLVNLLWDCERVHGWCKVWENFVCLFAPCRCSAGWRETRRPTLKSSRSTITRLLGKQQCPFTCPTRECNNTSGAGSSTSGQHWPIATISFRNTRGQTKHHSDHVKLFAKTDRWETSAVGDIQPQARSTRPCLQHRPMKRSQVWQRSWATLHWATAERHYRRLGTHGSKLQRRIPLSLGQASQERSTPTARAAEVKAASHIHRQPRKPNDDFRLKRKGRSLKECLGDLELLPQPASYAQCLRHVKQREGHPLIAGTDKWRNMAKSQYK